MAARVSTMLKRAETLSWDLEGARDDLQTRWDNASERWQDGDAGREAQDRIDYLDSAVAAMQEVIDALVELS